MTAVECRLSGGSGAHGRARVPTRRSGRGRPPSHFGDWRQSQRIAKKERFRPGARFMAMSAASIGIVPLPQKGSQKSSRPRQRESSTIAAAIVSLSGAALCAGR